MNLALVKRLLLLASPSPVLKVDLVRGWLLALRLRHDHFEPAPLYPPAARSGCMERARHGLDQRLEELGLEAEYVSHLFVLGLVLEGSDQVPGYSLEAPHA